MDKKIGIALSGGGFRAAAFHLGTLNKLHELGILDRTKILSTISGGAIVGTYYGLHCTDYNKFRENLYNKLLSLNLIREIILNIRFLLVNIIILLLIFLCVVLSKLITITFFILLIICLWKWQFKILPISKIIEQLYDRHFYDSRALDDLPEAPIIAINATNLQTGRLFTFSKQKMGDSAYVYNSKKPVLFKTKGFPIARAVMASTCVPHFFSPVTISKSFLSLESDTKYCEPQLIDGGIYDNQGIHKLTQTGSSYECDIIITSDAGNTLPYEGNYNNTFTLLLRTIELFMQRIKFLQMIKNIYQPSMLGSKKCIAYFSLGWDLENCITGFIEGLKKDIINREVIEAHNIPFSLLEDVEKNKIEITEILANNVRYHSILANSPQKKCLEKARKVKTNLKKIKEPHLATLIKHAENITELQVRLYCPHILAK